MAMKRFSEGAEAILYETEFLGAPAIAKERVRKDYRVESLDNEIRSTRTKTEARILARAFSNGISVPNVLMVEPFRLTMQRLGGAPLHSLLYEKLVSQKTLEEIMKESGKMLASLHNIDIVHGDFTPANIMFEKGKVSIIDFGLGEVTNSIEGKALDVLLMKRSIAKPLFKVFEQSYSSNSKDGRAILARVDKIEKRGRYQSRSLVIIK